ncbi:MAG: M20 family metallopeptidase [Candidatus Aerophobetes bacterium]|nr:M20 family metallopeptidase [Candidatus Aerophobetes bacterium]
MNIKRIRDNIDYSEMLTIAKELIQIPSENPPGNEREAAKIVEGYLRKFDASNITIYEPEKDRISVEAVIGNGRKTLAWNGHLDVVPVGDVTRWKHRPFGAEESDGKLWGRGSCDMKGSVAAALEVIAAIQRSRVELDGKLVFQAVADEEVLGSLGTKYLVENSKLSQNADAAICGEPTGFKLMVAAKGLIWPKITVIGRSCHGSTPEKGINAISKMAKVIQAFESIELKADHPILGRPTINIGTIKGGTKTNIVPDTCTITVDRRVVPGERKEEVVQMIKKLLKNLQGEDSELRIKADIGEEAVFAEPSEISKDEKIVKLVSKCYEDVSGKKGEVAGMVGTTDARFLINRGGIPTLIFGPGSLEQAHTIDEFVEIEALKMATDVFAEVIATFLCNR